MRNTLILLITLTVFAFMYACHPGKTEKNLASQSDSLSVEQIDTSSLVSNKDTVSGKQKEKINTNNIKSDLPVVLIYNFHVTNRCPSCVAIEEATTKTLNTYFAAEVKQGRIKRQILNVDDKANKFISEKYEAFGSGLFVT
ncbi:MAG: hypothetical protein HGB12_16980, partial [Bacteroidetes bacterium]|nr:hypothetical protein [Bacteroidota bacterium]